MSKLSNTDLIPFLGGTARVSAIGYGEAYLTSEDEPLVINNIPVEFRIWLKQNQQGTWYSTNIFAYRLDNEDFHPQRPATDSQKSKLYRAAIAAAEELTPRQFLHAVFLKAQAQLERASDEVEEAEIRRYEAQVEVQTLREALAKS